MSGDVELRLINPAKNQARLYALTECRTIFGELALRIVWGRIGHKRLRERTETFATAEALEQRRAALLRLRERHGYVVVEQPPARAVDVALERDIVETHGLSLSSPVVRDLVLRWHSATTELARVVGRGRGASESLDLVDVSTLAAMYAHAEGFG